MTLPRCFSPMLAAALLCAAATAPLQAQGPAPATGTTDRQDYSAAEKLLFMTPQLGGVKPPQTLRYRFRKTGAHEPGFEDQVAVVLSAQADGRCCAARGEFLGGERRLALPDLPEAESNPVILYFLEHDVREMQRLTKGQQNHFRQRIRMAVYNAASVREVSVRWRGQAVAASEISISPYLNDPARSRFEKFARKSYQFVLAPAVPGGVYAIRTRIDAPDGGAPLVVEEMTTEGAEPDKTTP